MAFPWGALLIGGGTLLSFQASAQQQALEESNARLNDIDNRIAEIDAEEEANKEYLRQFATANAYYAGVGGGSGPLNAANSALTQKLSDTKDSLTTARTQSEVGLSSANSASSLARETRDVKTAFAALGAASGTGGGGSGGDGGGKSLLSLFGG